METRGNGKNKGEGIIKREGIMWKGKEDAKRR